MKHYDISDNMVKIRTQNVKQKFFYAFILCILSYHLLIDIG